MVIHFAFNRITKEPFGIGILHTICASLVIGNSETRDPFYQIKGKMQQANELWVIPTDPEKLKGLHGLIRTLPKKGARFTTNIPEARVEPIVAAHAWIKLLCG